MQTKRNMALGGAALMALGLLAGCGGGDDNNSGSPSSQGQSSGAASSGASASSEKPLEVTLMRYESPNDAIDPNNELVDYILKTQNVKLQLQSVPETNYDDKKKTLIATHTMPDIMAVRQEDVQNYVDSGVFLDLTDYLDQMPNFKKFIEEEQPDLKKNELDGHVYGLPWATREENALNSGQMAVIRSDLLQKAGVTDLPKTYDELYQDLKKMKEADPSTYPFSARAANGLSGTENLINPIAFGFGSGYTNESGTKIYFEPKTQQYAFGPESDEFKQAIEYLHKLYAEGLLQPGYATANSTVWKEQLSSGKSTFYFDNFGYYTTFNPVLQKTNPDANFQVLHALQAPNGTTRNILYHLGHTDQSYVINAKVKDPDRVVKFMDWFYSPEGIMATNFGVEGVDYTLDANGNPVMTQKSADLTKDNAVGRWYTSTGAGYAQLTIVSDDRVQKFLAPDSDFSSYAIADEDYKNGQAFHFTSDPPFTSEERDQLKQIRSELDPYLAQNMDKFIIKDGAMDGWDDFVAQLKKKGADKMVEIYNAALARVK